MSQIAGFYQCQPTTVAVEIKGEMHVFLGNRAMARLLGVASGTITIMTKRGGLKPTLIGSRGPLWSQEHANAYREQYQELLQLWKVFHGPDARP